MKTLTNYAGSENTATKVAKQIAEKYGKEEVKKYDPLKNCRTFRDWIKNGYKVKRGETSIKSYIILKFKDSKNQEQTRLKTIHLFYIKQVELIKK